MEVAASVVGLLSVGAKISFSLERLVQGTTNAPSLAQKIKEEMNATNFILSKLHALDLGPTSDVTDRENFTNAVACCEATFLELHEHVCRLTVRDKMDIRDRFNWAWAESTLMPLLERLQQHKATLTLILMILKQHPTTITLTAHAPDQSTPTEPTDQNSLSPNLDLGTRALMKRPTFEMTLLSTRPYQRLRRQGSDTSYMSFERPTPRWSFFSGRSDTGVISLPLFPAGSPGLDHPNAWNFELPLRATSLLELRGSEITDSPGIYVTGDDDGGESSPRHWLVDERHREPREGTRGNKEDSAVVKTVQVVLEHRMESGEERPTTLGCTE